MTAIVEPKTKPKADRNEAPAFAAPRIGVERPVVLAARALRKAFGGQVVLDGVDLELREGEVILLRGDNGSGKTTLINILTGNLEPDAGTIHYLADGSPREFRFPRRWWQELNPFDHFTPESTAREGIGRMWQDVRLFNSQTLRENITVAEPRHLGENPIRALFTPGRCRQQEAEIARKADEMLARLGLAGRESSSGDKISLGQSKRVAIARAVAAGARILFLDEPLAGLDRQGIRDVLSLLESIARDHAVTLVIVEHVFNHPHLHGLVSAEWLLESGKLRPNGVSASKLQPTARSPWLSILAEDAELIEESLPRGARLTRIRRAGGVPAQLKPLVEIRDVVIRLGARIVLGLDDEGRESGFSLTLYEGDTNIIEAPNGWGKSTLFSAITGRIRLSKGTLKVAAEVWNELPTWKRHQKGLRALSSDKRLFPSLSVSEALGLAAVETVSPELQDFTRRACSALSGGESQLVAVSCITSGVLGLYDEPFSALDATRILSSPLQRLSRLVGTSCYLLPISQTQKTH